VSSSREAPRLAAIDLIGIDPSRLYLPEIKLLSQPDNVGYLIEELLQAGYAAATASGVAIFDMWLMKV
jgi:hypothetical protein